MGVGAATILPSTLSIITNLFPTRQRARAIGVWSAAAGVGLAIGPVAGGYLLENWWWGSVFLVNVPFVVVGLITIRMLVPDSRDPRPGRIDPAGVALSMVGIVAFVFGIAQFLTTFLIAWWYSRHAAAQLDPKAEAIKSRMEGGA